jgi:hypothetical protein
MLITDRRRVHPSRHRAGLARYRLTRTLYRAGPIVLPVRRAYRALATSFSWITVPPPERPVTMWQYGHVDHGLGD